MYTVLKILKQQFHQALVLIIGISTTCHAKKADTILFSIAYCFNYNFVMYYNLIELEI